MQDGGRALSASGREQVLAPCLQVIDLARGFSR